MKTILYSLIAIFIIGIVARNFTNKVNTKKVILIQAVDNKASSVLLSRSAEIISNRLKDFSSEKFDITTIPEKNQIQVTLFNGWDPETTEGLMIQKGTLAFYETYNSKALSELLKGNNHLFSLLNNGNANDSSAEIGCTSAGKIAEINGYLTTLRLNQKCKFAWSQRFDKSNSCLYALKIDSAKGALITENDIKSVTSNHDKASKNNEIVIRLKESVVESWANATKRNLNNAIAIVLDNHVLSSPVIRSVINGGNCTISGGFTEIQTRYIAAIGNNGKLPLTFKVIK